MSTLRKLCILSTVAVGAVALLHGPSNEPKYVSLHTPRLPAPAFQLQYVTKSNLQAYVMSQPLVVPKTLQQWNTEAHDPTATWPDATDPLLKLPIKVQAAFACIRWHESRNHLHSLEVHSGAGGWYQFIPYIWSYARAHIPGLPEQPQVASGDQQSRVAIWYYHRNGGFVPEWDADSSCW